MSLDDMIKKSGPGKGKGGGRGAASGGRGAGAGSGRGGAIKRGGVARSARQSATPYKKPAKGGGSTLSSMATNSRTNAASKNAALKQSGGLTTGGSAKVKVANLDTGVTSGDIKELFGEIGNVKSAEVVTNQAGASKGFAMVTYHKKADAQKAIETYNGVPLDGKPLKITMAGGGAGGAESVRVVAGGGERKVVVRGGERGERGGKGAGRGAGRGAGGGAGGERGRGRGKGKGGAGGRGRGKKEEQSAEQMDADLDSWKTGGGD